jgi:hypothetical protein
MISIIGSHFLCLKHGLYISLIFLGQKNEEFLNENHELNIYEY